MSFTKSHTTFHYDSPDGVVLKSGYMYDLEKSYHLEVGAGGGVGGLQGPLNLKKDNSKEGENY